MESHDWAAPLDESGRPTEKYLAFRSVIQRALNNETLHAIPKIPGTASIGPIELKEQCRLLDCLPQGKTSPSLQTMEELDQSTGLVAYRTTVEGPLEGGLALGAVKDRVQVMLDGELLGISGRSPSSRPLQ